MIIVLIGIILQLKNDGFLTPLGLLFTFVVIELIIVGLLHPLELKCLIYFFIYFITLPSMYMLLTMFALFNMDNISWGTRDQSDYFNQSNVSLFLELFIFGLSFLLKYVVTL